eukprot:4290737-Pleurochrysis_carterae.AAC.6
MANPGSFVETGESDRKVAKHRHNQITAMPHAILYVTLYPASGYFGWATHGPPAMKPDTDGAARAAPTHAQVTRRLRAFGRLSLAESPLIGALRSTSEPHRAAWSCPKPTGSANRPTEQLPPPLGSSAVRLVATVTGSLQVFRLVEDFLRRHFF